MNVVSFKLPCKKIIAISASLFLMAFCFSQELDESVPNGGVIVSLEKAEPEAVVKIGLTVDAAIEYALQNSSSLKSAQIDLALAKLKKDNAWNVFLPSVQLTGTVSHANDVNSSLSSTNASMQQNKMMYQGLAAATSASNPALSSAYSAIANKMNPIEANDSMAWTALGNLSVSFTFNVAMIQSMKATVAAYEAGQITWEQTLIETKKNIKQLFYSLLLQQESLNLQKDSLENARQRMNQAATNYRNGYVPQIQYLQAQVAYQNQVPTIDKLEQQMRQSLDSFALLIGMPVGMKIELIGEINPEIVSLEVDKLINRGLSENLTIRNLKQTLKQLKMQTSAADLSSYTPSVVLSWNGQPMINSAFEKSWFEKDNWSDKGAFSISLAWNITNMLPWSSTQISTRELKENIKKLELSLNDIQRKTELDIRTAYDSLKQCENAIASSERNIELAQKSYNMTWLAYRNGTTEYLNLKEAQTQLDAAKFSLVTEKFNYMTSIMNLESVLNTTLTGDK